MFPYYTLVNKKTAKCSNSLLGLTVCLHFSGLRWNLIRQQSLHFVLDNFVFKTFFFFLKVLGWTNPIFCVGSWVRAKPARATERKTMFGRALLVFFPLSSPCYVSVCLFFCLFLLSQFVQEVAHFLVRGTFGRARWGTQRSERQFCSRENVLTLFSFTEKRSARKHFKKDKTINIKKKSALPQHTASLGRTPEENKKNKENTRAQTKTELNKGIKIKYTFCS